MSSIEESVEVEVSDQVAYNQWTQFEDFPIFMDGVEKVEQLTDSQLRWTARIGGVQREWTAEITEQIPDKRIAWKATEGAPNAGVVTFHRLDNDRCKVMLQLDFEPQDPVEKLGDAIGIVRARAKADLDRFKKFIEERGTETGAWREEIPQTGTS